MVKYSIFFHILTGQHTLKLTVVKMSVGTSFKAECILEFIAVIHWLLLIFACLLFTLIQCLSKPLYKKKKASESEWSLVVNCLAFSEA